ncbi:MAG: response regulator transcription factor [Oscillospiraceae bacterium]|nr:response regulator transcription factor [Oscillospiraceae bacterium]
MNKLTIALCDDDNLMLKVVSSTVKSTLLKLNISSEIRMFSSPFQLLSSLETREYDLFILDIEMPKLDGISLGMKLRQAGIDTPIIYLSAMEDRVYDSFETRPFTFIRKSRFIDDIYKVMKRFVDSSESLNLKRLVIRESNNRTVSLELSKVLYIESEIKSQKVYLRDNKEPIHVKCTMNYLEDELTNHGFLRSHRSYLINCKYIQYIEHETVYLTTGDTVPLGRSKSEEFMEKYLNLMT